MIIYGIAVKLADGLMKGVWYARVKSRKPDGLHVHICCHKHGFITRVSHQILLQKRTDGKLHRSPLPFYVAVTGAPFHFEELRETPTIKRREKDVVYRIQNTGIS